MAALAVPASASPGDLDGSFGGDGHVVVSPPGDHHWNGMGDGMVAADAIDGVWFAAVDAPGAEKTPRLIVTHRNEDGDPDLAFGRGGQKTYRVSGHGQLRDVRLTAVLPLADGDVQIAGQMGRGYGGSRKYSLMVRLAADGAYDTSLGGTGQAQSRVRSRSDSPALLAADGSWCVAILGRKGNLRVTHMTRDGRGR